MQALFRTLLWMACGVSCALGQDADVPTYPRLEYYAGYAAIETNDHSFYFTTFGPQRGLDYDEKGRGVEAEVIANWRPYFSVVGDFSAHFSSNPFSTPITPATCPQPPCPAVTVSGTINPQLFTFLAGPEFKWRNHTRITPFANTLLGLAHSKATMSLTGPVYYLTRSDSENGFAAAASGGFEIRITRRVGFRSFLTYSRAFVGSNVLPRQRVDAIGWCAGVVFH
jgi:hypothetical protein